MLKQQNKTGEIDLEGRADKEEGWDCWDVERGRVRGKKKIQTHAECLSWLLCSKTEGF